MHRLPDSLHLDNPALLKLKAFPVPDLTAKDPRIQRALEVFQQSQEVQLNDVADMLNLSSSRLRHLFTEEIGMSPRRYVKLVQLERAKELLETSFLRVKEVAALVGVSDISHFGRDYKAHYGHSPSETRQSGNADHPEVAGTAIK